MNTQNRPGAGMVPRELLPMALSLGEMLRGTRLSGFPPGGVQGLPPPSLPFPLKSQGSPPESCTHTSPPAVQHKMTPNTARV